MGRIKLIADKKGMARRAKGQDGNSCLIGHGYAVSGGVQLNTDYTLYRIEDAEAIGITKTNDIAQKMLVWYHISEYFRMAPGTKLVLKVLATSVPYKDLVDKAQNYLKKTCKDQKGGPRNVGVFMNKTSSQQAAATNAGGIDDDVLLAVPKAAEMWAYQQNLNRPLYCIILDGQKYSGNSATAGDLRALLATGVAIGIAQDRDVAGWDALFAKHSAVGTLLGTKAGRSVETNVGEVEGNNLQSKAAGRWLNPGLSSGVAITGYDDDPDTGDFKILGDKGYIMAIADQDDVVFNDDNTCDAIDSDFYCLANTAVYAKAHREIYSRIRKERNKKVLIDVATGNIKATDCARFENHGNEVIGSTGTMTVDGEISGGQSICDPVQDVLGTSNITLQFEVVPYGYARGISGTIKFSKTITSSN